MNTLRIFPLILILAIVSCKERPQKAVNYNLQERLQSITTDLSQVDSAGQIRLDFTGLVQDSWDSVLVITPYMPVSIAEQFNISNLNDADAVLKAVSVNDQYAGLLFVKGTRLIGYSTIPRQPVDFAHINKEHLGPVTVITPQNMERLYLTPAVDTAQRCYQVLFK